MYATCVHNVWDDIRYLKANSPVRLYDTMGVAVNVSTDTPFSFGC
jgi:hypothetical protein